MAELCTFKGSGDHGGEARVVSEDSATCADMPYFRVALPSSRRVSQP
jgi:hypothetical protein